MPEIILASSSPHRRALLTDAGVAFSCKAPSIDERAAEAPLKATGATPDEVALVLAQAKAGAVSAQNPGALVIGCDQTLSLDGELLHKVADMEAARRRLLELSGRTHVLESAVAILRDEVLLWQHVGAARMTMRKLDPAFVGRHLSRVGDKVLSSVGAYQIEGEGIQLFDKIEGDHFTIIGLPLLPLLGALRDLGAIDG